MVYGPLAHTVKDIPSLNESNGRIYAQYVNSKRDAPLPPNGLHAHVDVRDLARAHLSAATTESAGNKRFLITRGRISAQEISDILRAAYPTELADRTPVGPHPGTSSLGKGAYDVDTKTGQEALGLGEMKSNEATFVDLTKQLLRLEKGESYETDL
jgi:nucleoside-diphosphate-sugar epimerase